MNEVKNNIVKVEEGESSLAIAKDMVIRIKKEKIDILIMIHIMKKVAIIWERYLMNAAKCFTTLN